MIELEPMIPKDQEQRAPSELAQDHSIPWQARFVGTGMVWATKLAAAGFIKLDLIGTEHIQACIDKGRPIIFAGWHGHNFLTMCSYYKAVRFLTKGAILVPDSLNGTIMYRIGQKLDLNVVQVKPGSGSAGWGRATVSMIRMLRRGNSALLSPDGPEGPARQAKPGICVMAQQAQAIIIPASAAATPGLSLRGRWDSHLVPLPLARAVVRFGPPIDAAPSDRPQPSEEELRKRVEEALTAGELEASSLIKTAGKRGVAQP